jgi:sugar lactone lactonase YvrE
VPTSKATGTENDLRRMRVVAVAAVMGAAALAYSLPRVRAQNSSTSNVTSAGATAAAPVANAPIVVAQGISVRALALGPGASDGAATAAAENTQRPDIYLTALQMPNRVMAIPGSAPAGTNVSAAIAGVARGASNAPQAQAEAYATTGANLLAIAGNGTAGSLGDGGAGTSAELNLKFDSPYMRSGVAVAADGTIFIADTKNATIRRIASSSATDPGVIRSVAGKWGPAQNVQLVEPMGLALDRAGNLYIADHGANAVIELHDATASTPGRLEILAHVAHAASVALSPDGSRAYIAVPESGTVLQLDPASHAITTLVAGSGTSSSCLPAVTGGVTAATTASSAQPGAQNSCPDGLALDGGGNLFIADSAGSRILRIDAATQKLTTAASSISAPGDIAFDANGNLFVAEQGRNRIIEIKALGQAVSNVTLTPPPAPVPPAGVPCPTIAPPLGFTSNTNFCAEPLAGTTPTSTFSLTNNSNAEITGVTITTIGLDPADFVVSSTSCTTTLNVGSSCLINLGFAPTATGPRTATLVVTYTGATNPLTSSVAGTGDDYQIALASGQLTQISVNAGSTGTFNLQIVPDNIFTGTVTFVCPGNLPMATTCTFSPTSVNVTTPGTAVPFSVAFQTTSRVPTPPKTGAAPVVASQNRWGGPGGRDANSDSRGAILAFVLIAAILVLFSSTGNPVYPESRRACAAVNHMRCVGKRGTKRTRWLILQAWRERQRDSTLAQAGLPVLPKRFVPIACAIALSVAAILEGCHSGSGSSTGATGTPAGTTKMTVQATAQSAPRGITVTLDVQ